MKKVKTCSKCGLPFGLDSFYKRYTQCKSCVSARRKNHYRNNREKVLAQNKRWADANKAKKRAITSGWHGKNKDKHRDSIKRSKYGLTKEQLAELLERANGICSLCGRASNRLHIDHNHKTGKVRDMLCHACNIGLGFFRDDTQLLTLAIAYLEKHEQETTWPTA